MKILLKPKSDRPINAAMSYSADRLAYLVKKLETGRRLSREEVRVKRRLQAEYRKLPKSLGATEEDFKQRMISSMYWIFQKGPEANFMPQETFRRTLIAEMRTKTNRHVMTSRDILTEFRKKAPSEYSKFSSYMRRVGTSEIEAFSKYSKVIAKGYDTYIIVDLPMNPGKVSYTSLRLGYNWEHEDFTDIEMI